MQPTYYIKHPDGSFTKADPQPLMLTAPSIELYKNYQCGCSAAPSDAVPDYCPEHNPFNTVSLDGSSPTSPREK